MCSKTLEFDWEIKIVCPNYFRIRISHWQGRQFMIINVQHFDSDQKFGSLLSLLLRWHLRLRTIKKTISARPRNEYIFESLLWDKSSGIKLDRVKAVLSVYNTHVAVAVDNREIKPENWANSWDFGTFSLSSNAHVQTSSRGRCLIFGRTLRLLLFFMCANSEGSGEIPRCAGSPEPSLVAYAISTIIILSWFKSCTRHKP